MKKGLLIVYSGPSGVGKSTVREVFMKDKSLKLSYSVSMTTREIREGEKEGKDYFFVTRERFEEAIANGELLEYATYVGNYYGTPKAFVERLRKRGRNVILEIDVAGAKQIMEREPDCITIFVTPPSIEELESRLINRGTDSEEKIKQRLERARSELAEADIYDYRVCNIVIEDCAKEIAEIIRKEMNKING